MPISVVTSHYVTIRRITQFKAYQLPGMKIRNVLYLIRINQQSEKKSAIQSCGDIKVY